MNKFSKQLLDWYARHKRKMPWRDHPDPYAVWVSEIMLQQTQVNTVIPYFERWMKKFPTVKKLAAASEQDVLNMWEGLGYYSRARNLHKAAKQIAADHKNKIPNTLEELRMLPGIGRYTAAAIASMAFGMDVATLDGNLKRVFSRVFNVDVFADSPEGEKNLWALSEKNLPRGRAGDYNQALMDLGATICLPKNPQCLLCPLMNLCAAQKLGVQSQRPVTKPKNKVPTRIHVAALILKADKVLMTQRPSSGLLGGMWEFPNGESASNTEGELVSIVDEAYNLKVRPVKLIGEFHHAYTHFKLKETVYACKLTSQKFSKVLEWIPLNKLEDYPMGKIDRQIAKKLTEKIF